jgi:hypothetical protein
MSSFVNRLYVEFDKTQYPSDDNIVEVNAASALGPVSCLTAFKKLLRLSSLPI